MSEHAYAFPLVTIGLLVTIPHFRDEILFGGVSGSCRCHRTSCLPPFVGRSQYSSKTVADTLAALQVNVEKIEDRLTAIEKMLREVD